jgi:hypothetical protein
MRIGRSRTFKRTYSKTDNGSTKWITAQKHGSKLSPAEKINLRHQTKELIMRNRTKVLKLISVVTILTLLIASLLPLGFTLSERRQFREKYDAITIGSSLDEARAILNMQAGILTVDASTIPTKIASELDPAVEYARFDYYVGNGYAMRVYLDRDERRVLGKELLRLKTGGCVHEVITWWKTILERIRA